MSMKNAGLLFTLVGPAGVGKNQLMKHVMAHSPVTQLPTATTRTIREGEQEGREHFYMSEETFQQMIASDALLEWQKVHRRYYGMVRTVVEAALDKGQPIIADIDIFGAIHIRERYPDKTVSVFIQPPSIGSLIDRMRTRGDRESEISKRLLRVPLELEHAQKCDYIVVNDTFEHAADRLLEIVLSELQRQSHRPAQVRVELPLPYRYNARVVPILGDQVLACGGVFPTAIIGRDDQPADRALAAIARELNVIPNSAQLLHGDKHDDGYVPPLSLDYVPTADDEQIIYHYAYRLDASFTAPPGWSWSPLHMQPDLVRGLVG